MKKMNRLALLVVVLLIGGSAAAFGQAVVSSPQAAPIPVGQPNAAQIGVDTAQQNLQEVYITRFEDPGMWVASMPLDEGLVQVRGLPGAPAGRKPIPEEQKLGINVPDNTVLGVKVTFFKRGYNTFSVAPVRPLMVEGIVKTISVWVVGRNTNHFLNIVVEDLKGQKAVLPVGPLNFTGWKQLTVAVPPSLDQIDFRYGDRTGLLVDGFVVDCNPLEDYGTFYVYFDDMTAVTDLFPVQQRSADDMSDSW